MRSPGSGQSHAIFSRLRIPPRLDTIRPPVRTPPDARWGSTGWPSNTSRASAALSGRSSATAALMTRWTKPIKLRTESTGRSAR